MKFTHHHATVFFWIGLLALALFSALAYKYYFASEPQQIACTQEAKLCPDGSAVGRIGPNCEFAACPNFGTSDVQKFDTSVWKIYRNEKYGFEVKYPKEWDEDWVEEVRPDLVFIGRVVNPERAGKPDTDVPIEQFFVRSFENSCEVSDSGWGVEEFAGLPYRELCIKRNGWPIIITMNAFDEPAKKIMDQILSTFKFIDNGVQ